MRNSAFVFFIPVMVLLHGHMLGSPRYSYMGRYGLISYQPVVVIPYVHGIRGFALRHNVSYEHLLGKLATVGICADYYSRKINPRLNRPYDERFNYRSVGYAAGIHAKIFRTRRGFYAPNGEFFKVQFMHAVFATVDDNMNEKFGDASKTELLIPSFGLGTNYFFNARYKIGVEVDFNLHINPAKYIDKNAIKPFYDADWVISFGRML